ncbi:hypothetical protein AAVH_42850 [Aphelenchoides avenae]|nr:hypothetical protein AAVH_42850 [Aphelenchus avenae]
MTKDHNEHLPDPALAAKYRVATTVKAAARANVLAPSGQLIDKHLAELEADLIDVYRNDEVRPLLRSLWALAFLPPEEVVDGYTALVAALNVLNNRQVDNAIPLDPVNAPAE